MKSWFGAFLVLSLASCGAKPGHEVDLSQLDWTVACQSGRVKPCSADVPGHVLPSLVKAGLAPNLTTELDVTCNGSRTKPGPTPRC